MALVLNGSGSITGLSAGGLPDGSVTADDIASTLDLSGKTVTLPSGVGGKVLQVQYYTTGAVQTGTTTFVNDDTRPTSSEGNQWFTITVTPQSATSQLLVRAYVFQRADHGLDRGMICLYRDSGDADACGTQVGADSYAQTLVEYLYDSNSTSSTTFKVRGGSTQAGTVTLNGTAGSRYFGGYLNSMIVVTEIES